MNPSPQEQRPDSIPGPNLTPLLQQTSAALGSAASPPQHQPDDAPDLASSPPLQRHGAAAGLTSSPPQQRLGATARLATASAPFTLTTFSPLSVAQVERTNFIAKVSKTTASLLPVSHIQEGRKETMLLGTTPRHSRRITGAGVEFSGLHL